ncbi:hypothetical protein CEV33_1857 [Brucella grignonensis]|uniref:Uncharacterized protein n=1 Tax=Brucella grignonensis TaxID=94627 RepID=A0A256F6R9_9HYPH|nr:hypothetical protein [Brucella grignonensis]OYR10396.1 hypothetical protein CEV33_1857 [Brucella grignonensis]
MAIGKAALLALSASKHGRAEGKHGILTNRKQFYNNSDIPVKIFLIFS